MFGWFRKKEETLQEFPDNRTAFEYACENQQNRILLEAVIPALVEEDAGRTSSGERAFKVRLAARNGGRPFRASTLAEATDWPEVGDFVGFRIVQVMDDFAPDMPIGYISCVLQPVLVGGKGWRIARNLTPKNIKQAIRF